MRIYLSERDIVALRKAVSLLKTEYEGSDPDDTPQAPEQFWDDLEAADIKLKVAQRRQRA